MKENSSILSDWFDQTDAIALAKNDAPIPEDFVGAVKWFSDRVGKFLMDNKLVDEKNSGDAVSLVANESLNVNNLTDTLGAQAVWDLVDTCKIPAQYRCTAVKRIGNLLHAALSAPKNPANIWAAYNRASNADNNANAIALESLYPSSLLADLTNAEADAATEAFGIHMNIVQPDLKLALTVSLLQFHTALTPKLVPVVPTSQPNVTIVREEASVTDMSKPKDKPIRMIELYRDPSKVTSVLKQIVPLKAADTDDQYLDADGELKFNVKIPLFDLSLIKDKEGWDRYNHTDIIADNVKVSGIVLTLATGAGGTPASTTETFLIQIPSVWGNLTPSANSRKSSDRFMHIDNYQVVLTNRTPKIPTTTSNTETSALLAGLADSEGIMVNVTLSAHVNLSDAVADAQCFVTLTPHSRVAGVQVTEDTHATLFKLVDDLKKGGSAPASWLIDARYSEENLRKTTLRNSVDRRSMSIMLPTGRAIVIDWAFGQEAAPNAAARLAQTEHLGRDHRNVHIIDEVATSVYNDQKLFEENPEAFESSIGEMYAAGSVVNPYVYQGILDLTKVLNVRSSDSSGDIKQYTLTKLNAIVAKMLANSLLKNELSEGTVPVFRLLTSSEVEGVVLRARQIHQHLDVRSNATTAGVDYVIELDCGARLEVVTSTFKDLDNAIYIIPFLNNSSSVLNFGLNYDLGTMIGNYTASHDGLHQRIFATSRELLIPTNVLCAKLSVQGMDQVSHLAN